MIKSTQMIAGALLALLVAGPSQAAGPFNLFSSLSCCSDCDQCCDSCEPDCGCEPSCCEPSCCEPGCCDSGCCDSGCCDSGCCDSGCDGIGCGSALFGLLGSDPCNRNYVSLFGGWNFLHDYNGNAPAPLSVQTSGSFNDGWAIGGAIGREIGSSFRGELEFAFRDNTGDEWVVNGASGTWSGHANVYSGMTNLYYDFKNASSIKPYIGGGIGFATVDAELVTSMTTINVDDTAFAYQAIAGLATAISANVEVFGEYRYFGFDEIEVENVDAGYVFDGKPLDTENVFFGVRLFR